MGLLVVNNLGARFLRARSILRITAKFCCLLLLCTQGHASPTLANFEHSENSHTLSALARLTVSPVNLSGGSSLTVVSPESWSALSSVVETALQETHHRLTNLLGTLPMISTSVRLMTAAAFTRATGAPEWTNALYVRGQILLPIGPEQLKDYAGVSRSVSHEYTHAVVNALSNGKAAGWLDEGFAQWIEGEENPILKPALYDWLTDNEPIELSRLQGGFTKLPHDTVPAAYAQSLLSATIVLNTYGFEGMRRYLDELKSGATQDEAIYLAFNSNPVEFEQRLAKTLRRWRTQQTSGQSTRASLAKDAANVW